VNRKLRAYLDLVRAPNLFTAAADVIAGSLYVGVGLSRWGEIIGLVLASMCLYAGGVVLNDVCDWRRDSVERPQRPIPSGRISRPTALHLVIGLLALGFMVAACVSTRAAVIAGLLIVAIVLYNAVLKSTPLAPAVMGLCRALNLALGMWHSGPPLWTPAESGWATPAALTPIGLMWLYVASVTYFARHEAGVSSRFRLTVGTIGVCAAVAGLSALAWIVPNAQLSFLWLVGSLTAALAYLGFRAALLRSPEVVQAAVRSFVISLILFDACMPWAARGALAAILVASLVVPTVLLARSLRVT